MASEDDEAVGYGRPPKHTRFVKGRSGNPGGRPQGSRNIKSILEERLSTKVRVREGGKVKTLTVAELIVSSATSKAGQGHTPSQALVFALWEKTGGLAGDAPPTDQPLPEEDEALLRSFLARRSGKST